MVTFGRSLLSCLLRSCQRRRLLRRRTSRVCLVQQSELLEVRELLSSITLGTTVQSQITPAGDVDTYEFTLNQPGWLYFDGLDSDYYTSYWKVTGPNGQPASGEGWNGDNHAFYAPIAGAYTLTLNGNVDETKNYSFRLLDLSAATSLTYGNAVTTTLSPANETDAYKFTAAAGDKVNITTSLSANPQSATWYLYDPLGNYVTSSSLGNDQNNLVLNLAGTYTLLVQGPYSDTGTTDYTLKVAFVSNTPPAAVTGTAITLGSTVSNSFASAGQTKNFKFTLAGPGWLYFDGLDSDYYSSYWKVIGPNGEPSYGPAGNYAPGEGWNGDNHAFYAPVAGDYQLQMSDANNQGAHNFSFRVLDLGSATSITPGNVVNGTLNSARKTDTYKFTATAGDKFFLDSQTAAPQSAYWRLLDPLGQQVTGYYLAYDLNTFTVNLTGTYTLLIEGPYYDTGTTAYTFNVQPVTVSSTPLTLGATVNGSISVPRESDQYTFNVAGPGWFYFDGLDSDYYTSYWKVTGPNGQPASGEGWNGDNHAFYAPIAGAYTLTLNGNVDETKNYSFRLLDLSAATALTPGTPVSGTLNPANETDLYKFTATAGDRFYFDSQTATPQSAYWRLLDPLGQQVTGYYLYSDLNTLTLNLTGTYTLLIEGPSYDTGTTDYTFVVNSIEPNLGPTEILLANNTVAENQPSGTTVGVFSTPHIDAGDVYTYTLVPGTGADDNASFTIDANGNLKTAASFDFETKNVYSIRVRVTYAGGQFVEKVLTINVTDVNEAPTNIALSKANIAENQPSGSTVGNFSATDPDAANTFTYSLVSGTGSTNNGSFTISGNQLKTAASFNFEVKNSYSIRVRVTDQGGLFFEKVFTITVTDVNEAPTNIALTNTSVAENQPVGTPVGNFSATDQDAGENHTFALVAGIGSTDNSSFSIVGNQLQTAASFDFETKSSYSIRVQVTDKGGLTFVKVFTITVTNVNEAPTDIALSNASVAENQASGTAVGNFSTTDVDAGDTFTYTLVSGTGSTDNASFTISGNQIKTAASFNFEAKNSYSVRVRSTDAGGLFVEKVFVISVTNVNETPTDIALTSTSVPENQPVGTVVGNFSATDPDAGNTFTYALVTGTGSTDNASFTISGNQLKTNAMFDFETKSSYSIRVRVTDQGGLFFNKIFMITITDANDAPTDIALSNASVAENLPSGTTVGNFSSTDIDAGDTFTYTLVAGTGSTDNASFTISGNQLKTNASFNFEAKNSYSVRVRSTDAGGLFFEKVFVITVTNVNETPTNLALSNSSVTEGQPVGTVVGNFSSTDVDAGDTFTYTLVSGTGSTDNASFTIAGNQLKTAAVFNFQTKSSYSIRVRTTDAGGLSFEKQLTISVTQLNAPPVVGSFGDPITYIGGGPAQPLSSTATVNDNDSPNFNTGTLTVQLTANGQATDLLSIKNVGTGSTQINVSGNQVFIGTNLLGTFTGGDGTTPLVITMTANATPGRIQNLLRNILFSSTAASPPTAARTVQVTLTDGSGGTSTPVSKSINVLAPPVIGAFDDPVTYIAKGPAQQVSATATVSDSDSPNFNTGTLTVKFTANGQGTDKVWIRNVGTGSTQINVSGNQVFIGTNLLGTFTGGNGTTPLVITLTANATPGRVQNLLRNIMYSSTSATPSTLPRTVQVNLTDGAGGMAVVSKTINVVINNAPPVVGSFGDPITYIGGGPAQPLSSTATVSDSDSPNFDTGTLTVQLTANGQATDLLSIRNVGTGSTQINVSGNQVFIGANLLGTFTGGNGTTPLVITLTANATPGRVQNLMRNIMFSITTTTPSTTVTRTVQVTLTDGDGGTSTPVSKSINVLAPPVIGTFGDSITYTAGGSAQPLSATATVSDSDSPNFNNGTLTVKLTANGQGTDKVWIRNVGTGSTQINVSGNQVFIGTNLLGTFTGGNGTTPLVITLTANATPGRVQNLLRNIMYSSTSATPSTLPRTVQVTLTDGAGGMAVVSKTINVLA